MFSQGDKGTSWYIIWKGSVNVVTHGKVDASLWPRGSPDTSCHQPPAGTKAPTPSLTLRVPPGQGLVATLHEGDDFGQLALVNDAPRAATIILREDNCHFLRVDKQDFNRILKVGRGWAGCWVQDGMRRAPSTVVLGQDTSLQASVRFWGATSQPGIASLRADQLERDWECWGTIG